MVKNFEDLQQVSKDNVDVTLKAMGAISKGTQAIAVEVADYSKKAFEDGTAALEKLFGVKSLDKAIEVQTEYAKTAYEGFVAKASKIGELYADLAKETYKPFEIADGEGEVSRVAYCPRWLRKVAKASWNAKPGSLSRAFCFTSASRRTRY